MLREHLDSKFGPGQYSQVLLTDLSDKVSVASAIKDVAGVAHVAINTQISPNPEPYIPKAIKETFNVLKAAEAEASVKSVVLTSSSMAAFGWGAKCKIPEDAYNEEIVKLAWDPSVQHPAKQLSVYAAAKTQAEQAAWKFVQEGKPHHVVNTILPNCNFGPSVNYEKQGHASTGGWAKALYEGGMSFISNVPPQHYIDVRDAARLHIAALINPDTENERLWGFAEPYSWNSVLAIFRKMWPQKEFIEDLPGLGWDENIIPTESALKALKDVFGQDGWTGIETSPRESGFDRE